MYGTMTKKKKEEEMISQVQRSETGLMLTQYCSRNFAGWNLVRKKKTGV